MPQSPFQQSQQPHHSGAQSAPTTPATAAASTSVYQHSPYAVHSLPPHPAFVQTGDHQNVVQYASALHHSHGSRWVSGLDSPDNYRHGTEDPNTSSSYEIDHHQQPTDHQPSLQPPQQHLQSMQGPSAHGESQSLPALQPITSTQTEPMSPAQPHGIIVRGIYPFLQFLVK